MYVNKHICNGPPAYIYTRSPHRNTAMRSCSLAILIVFMAEERDPGVVQGVCVATVLAVVLQLQV